MLRVARKTLTTRTLAGLYSEICLRRTGFACLVSSTSVCFRLGRLDLSYLVSPADILMLIAADCRADLHNVYRDASSGDVFQCAAIAVHDGCDRLCRHCSFGWQKSYFTPAIQYPRGADDSSSHAINLMFCIILKCFLRKKRNEYNHITC